METVTFLVTGFTVTGSYRRGQVTFREPVQPSAPEFSALQESRRHCRCPFPIHVFPRASIELPKGDSSSNQQKALHERSCAGHLCIHRFWIREVPADRFCHHVHSACNKGKRNVRPHADEQWSGTTRDAVIQDSGSRGLPRAYCAPPRKGQFGSHGSREAASSGATLVPTRKPC